MFNFIKKLSIFVLVCIIILTIIITIPSSILKRKADFKIQDNTSIAIFGHSHPECAYDDSIIPNVKNLANSGEAYFYTYQKIKKTLSQNPHIETVFVEFSNNQIDGIMDQWTWGYDKMSYFLPTYLPFMDYRDLDILNNHNQKNLISTVSVATRKNLFRFLKSDYNYIDDIGGYQSVDVSVVEKILDTLNTNKNDFDTHKISEVNLNYLRKIIDYCKTQKKNIYLIRSPQHKDLQYLNNEKIFQSIRKQEFSDVDFIDFNFNDLPNNYFADLEHLNNKGAHVLSNTLKGLLDEGLLTSKEKFFKNGVFLYFIKE